MDAAASDVYEIVLIEPEDKKQWIRSIVTLMRGLFSAVDGSAPVVNPGGRIISVVHQVTGAELFRHIEDMGDDDGHLLDDIQNDLATMTAVDFASRWG